MTNNLYVLIPARGGSKRFKSKNTHLFHGKPLLWYTIEFTKKLGLDKNCYVSSDENKILKYAKSAGVNSLIRPSHLSLGSTRISDVAIHFVEHLTSMSIQVDFILLLQPTNPLRCPEYLEEMINLIESQKADCVFTTFPAKEKWGKLQNGRYIPGNYTFEEQFFNENQFLCECGMMYLFRTSSLLSTGSLFGDHTVPMKVDPIFRYNDIDNKVDLFIAEALYTKYKNLYNFP